MVIFGGVGEKNLGASFRNQRCFLVASGGMLCGSDRSLSICLWMPFASTSVLLAIPLVVRWLLYNILSHIQYVWLLPLSLCFKVTVRGDDLSHVRENGVIRGVECSKTHTGISLFSFPRKRAALIHSHLLMSLVSSWLCGVCNGFTVLTPSVPGIYTQPRVRVRAYVVIPCSWG